jgi:hypothetical protein
MTATSSTTNTHQCLVNSNTQCRTVTCHGPRSWRPCEANVGAMDHGPRSARGGRNSGRGKRVPSKTNFVPDGPGHQVCVVFKVRASRRHLHPKGRVLVFSDRQPARLS